MGELEKQREQIDRIDREVIDLLGKRFYCSSVIGRIKVNEGISALQSERWEQVLSSRMKYAIESGLPEKFAEDFLRLVHDESVRIQKEIMQKGDNGS